LRGEKRRRRDGGSGSSDLIIGFQYLIPSTGTHRVRGRSRRHEHTGRKLHAAGTFAAAHVPIPPTS